MPVAVSRWLEGINVAQSYVLDTSVEHTHALRVAVAFGDLYVCLDKYLARKSQL